jgi:hypothetical protein
MNKQAVERDGGERRGRREGGSQYGCVYNDSRQFRPLDVYLNHSQRERSRDGDKQTGSEERGRLTIWMCLQ